MEVTFRYPPVEGTVPAAAYVHLKIAAQPGSDVSEAIPALVDSGADRTIVPLGLADSLGLQASTNDFVLLRGITGDAQPFSLYYMYVAIGESPLLLAEVVVMKSEEYVTLGRDVLAHYRVLLDGPAQTVTISK
jgi:hypothetical protein